MTTRNLAIDPTTGDIQLAQGQLQLVSDSAAIAQAVTAMLRTFQGEWFLDPALGVPYFQNIFGVKGVDARILRSTFVNAILSVKGVRSVQSLNLNYSAQTRSLTVQWRAVGDFGLLISGQTGL